VILLPSLRRTYPKVKRTRIDKVTGRKKAVSKRKTVRQQIEEWPRISRYEMEWGKDIGRQLVPLAGEDTRFKGHVGDEKSFEASKKFLFAVHTHPLSFSIKRRGGGVPSKVDIFSFLERVEANPDKRRAGVVVSLNEAGEVMGYTVFALKKGKAAKEVQKELNRRFSSWPFLRMYPGGNGFVVPGVSSSGYMVRAYQKALVESGIRLKHVAMPGYRFDRKSGKFKREGLVRKAIGSLKRGRKKR